MAAGTHAETALRDARGQVQAVRELLPVLQSAALASMEQVGAVCREWEEERGTFRGSISDLMGMVSSHAMESASLHKVWI